MSINGYRLLVIDIDGTLIDGRGAISEADKRALARVRERDVRVSLSTGRALKACRPVISELGLDSYHVSFDGALVSTFDLAQEVCASPIPPGLVRDMVGFAREHEINLELYSATRYMAERRTWSTTAHEEFFVMDAHILDFNGIWERERIIKGGLVVTNQVEAAKAQLFFDYFSGRLHISAARTPAYPGVVFNNLLAPDVSKGKAVTDLAAYLGVPMSAVMAVGDGSNDVSLLGVVGLGVAMGNAADEVKAAADYVTLDVAHSGLAAAVERFLV